MVGRNAHTIVKLLHVFIMTLKKTKKMMKNTAPTCHGDPILSKMETQWGPNFGSDGDLMGTFASRNGDPKSIFLKIDQNKLVS